MSRHILIAADAPSLQRWRDAFPDATVFATPQQARGQAAAGTIVWFHLPAADAPGRRELVAQAIEAAAPAPLVAMSDQPSDDECLEMMQLGVVGYCHAYAGAALLAQVATVVDNKGLWVRPDLLTRLIRASLAVQPARTAAELEQVAIETLSPREREVAEGIGRGLANKEIARELDITERTVKAHLSAIFSKLSVRDRVHLALLMRDLHAAETKAQE